jgi:uncharacterized protein involved in exopolysaccharide biosynthesis
LQDEYVNLRVNRRVNADQPTFKDLVLVLRGRLVLIGSTTLVFGLVAGVDAYFSPKWYEAAVVLSPVSTSASSSFSGAGGGGSGLSGLGGLGGLAAMAGLNIGGDSKKAESVATLVSEAVTERYLQDNNLLPVIYANKWDATRQTWKKIDKNTPTLWKTYQYFKKQLRTVETDTKSGIVSLKIRWKDPALAASWANGLADLTNKVLREKAIRDSERNIQYLTEEAAKTTIVEARQAIYSIMQGEINKSMLARGADEYAFKIIDPARTPERKTSPITTLWGVVGLFAGFFLSSFAVLAHASWTRS